MYRYADVWSNSLSFISGKQQPVFGNFLKSSSVIWITFPVGDSTLINFRYKKS